MANLHDFDVAFDSLAAFMSTHGLEKELLTEIDKLAQVVDAVVTINDGINRVHQWLFEVEKSVPLRDAQRQTTALISNQTHSWFNAGERMLKTMQEEREWQKQAVHQIGHGFEEKRLCLTCRQRIREKCFRQRHFRWCTVHEGMVGKEHGICMNRAHGDSTVGGARCNVVQCDEDEEEVYWVKVE